jgi:hypothetical protein
MKNYAHVIFREFDCVLKQVNQNLIQTHLVQQKFHVTLVVVQVNFYISEISLCLHYVGYIGKYLA